MIILELLSQSLCQAGKAPWYGIKCAGFSEGHNPPAERGITMCGYDSFNQLSPALRGLYTVCRNSVVLILQTVYIE